MVSCKEPYPASTERYVWVPGSCNTRALPGPNTHVLCARLRWAAAGCQLPRLHIEIPGAGRDMSPASPVEAKSKLKEQRLLWRHTRQLV